MRKLLRSASSQRCLVLAYHAIADLCDDPVLAKYSVPQARFAEQLDFLRERGWSFVDLDAVLGALRGGAPLPERAVLLSFDDAYADLREEAAPILAARGIPAVAFAVAGQIGGDNVWDSRNGATSLPLLDAEGLRAVATGGIEIGAHTTNHRALTEVPAAELEQELEGAAETIEAVGLPRPRAFSYPFGRWSPELAERVAAAGYEVAFTVDRGVVDPKADPHALPRFAVHADDSGRRLDLKLRMATWPRPVRGALRGLFRFASRA